MTWRMSIVHTSVYRYAKPVTSSYNEIRMTPLQNSYQDVIESQIDVEPETPLYRYTDYWGTVVHAFDMNDPHTELRVVSSTIVDHNPQPLPESYVETSWSDVCNTHIIDQLSEYLEITPLTMTNDELLIVAKELRRETVNATCDAVVAWVHKALAYVPGTTSVETNAIQAWRNKAGVCQDYAHLTIALARALAIPARYVSGYFHPKPSGKIGEKLAGESHAWVDLWCNGWRSFDPTNHISVAERHVMVGSGRDYSDVAPLHGVYHGGAGHALEVEVLLTRLA